MSGPFTGVLYVESQEIASLRATNDAQKQRIATLEAALKPFAGIAKNFPAELWDTITTWQPLIVGDIRKAAALIAEKTGEE